MLDHIRGQLERHAIPAASICFEITETVAISGLGRVGNFMRELHALGCHFSLDDFGSGMSSFGYLRELPVDYLKIDGRFVKNMATDHIDRAIVQSIQQIGEVMGIATIAEWVEDAATISLLRDMGVNYAQGYAVGKPAPFEDMHFVSDKPEPAVRAEPTIIPLSRTKHHGE
jgi:Amt family ammonium transporter